MWPGSAGSATVSLMCASTWISAPAFPLVNVTRRAALVALAALSFAAPAFAEGKPHWMLTLKDGVVDIELLPEIGHTIRMRVSILRKPHCGIAKLRFKNWFSNESHDA